MAVYHTVKYTVTSPNFLMWRFCEKAQAIRPKLCGDCTFPQYFHTRKLGEITVFFAVSISEFPFKKLATHSLNFALRGDTHIMSTLRGVGGGEVGGSKAK